MLTFRRFSICGLTLLLAASASPADNATIRTNVTIRPAQIRELNLPDMGTGAEHDRRCLFSPDGKLLLFGYRYDSQVQIWDLARNKKAGTIQGNFRGNGWAGAFSPDSRFLATTDLDHYGCSSVDVWDLSAFKKLRNLDEDVNLVPFACVAFAPDGKSLALGAGCNPRSRSADLMTHLWNVESGAETQQLVIGMGGEDPLPTRRTLIPGVEAVAFSPDARTLAVVSQNRIHLIEMLTGKERGVLGTFPTLHQRPIAVAAGNVRQVTYSPDGRTLGLLTSDGVLRLWDVCLDRALPPLCLDSHTHGAPQAFYFSADSRELHAFAGLSKLVTWNLAKIEESPAASTNLAEAELTQLWERLADGDKRHVLFETIQTLSAHPQEALPFLEARLQPVPIVEPRYLDRLIRDLQQADFNARKRAAAELRLCGEQAIHALMQAQENRFDELTRKMLDKLAAQFPTREQVRETHALHILENINNATARALLEKLANGAPAATLTREAKKTLERMPREKSSSAAANIEQRCKDLGSADALLAYDAMLECTRRPGESLPVLRNRLQNLVKAMLDDSPQRVAALLSELDAPDFATREKSASQLARLGTAIEPQVRRALDERPSLEQKNRLEKLLRQFASHSHRTESLELERGIEVLQRISAPESRRLLTDLRDACHNRAFKSMLDGTLSRLGK